MKKFLREFLKVNILAIAIGLFISLFLFVLEQMVNFNEHLIEGNYILYYILIMIISLFITYYLLNKNKNCFGSGIPQLEDYLLGNREIKPIGTILNMFLVCSLTFLGGIGLGSEGPSVYFGGLIGIYINKIFKDEQKEYVSIGGACGFGCAFLSPICGFTYAFEELELKINFKNILRCLYICSVGFLISKFIFGHKLIEFELERFIEWKYLGLFVILGIVCSLMAYVFVYCIVKAKDLLHKINIKRSLFIKLLIAFGFATLTNIFLFQLSGSGFKGLEVLKEGIWIEIAIFLIIFRLVFTSLSAASNISGGLVIPMLLIGGAVGNLMYLFSKDFFGISEDFNVLFMVCGMVSLFGSATGTPVTSLLLSFSFVNFKYVFFPVVITICFSTLISYVIKQKDIYHLLVKRLN